MEYKLIVKNSITQTKESSITNDEGIISSFCSENAKYLGYLISRINNIGRRLKAVKLDSHIIHLIQMFIFVNEINKSVAYLVSDASPFYEEILQLKKVPSIKHLFEENFLEKSKMKKYFFNIDILNNKKISQILAKRFLSPQTIVCKSMLQPLHREMATSLPFVIELNTRLLFFKHLLSSVPRSLYYLYQKLKSKSKEVESSRIGRILRQKLKVPRENIIENGKVYFDTYGAKSVKIYISF